MGDTKRILDLVEFEQVEIIRRIVERGLAYSLKYKDSEQVDLWQHAYDEVIRLKNSLEKE